MFKNKTNQNLLYLSVCGAFLIVMSLYLQSNSMDLSKYSFLEYLKHDATSFTWWQAIGLPLFIGVSFIIASVKAIKNETTSKKAMKILAITLAISVIAIPFNAMAGILSTSIITMSLLSQIIYEKKHNKRVKISSLGRAKSARHLR